ncbi:MAG: SEC-C domain-containing protein [Betaproteobacteria bacterium]|nr:SEC-C domain-containing protein [Betaproteobacteria bacterium]
MTKRQWSRTGYWARIRVTRKPRGCWPAWLVPRPRRRRLRVAGRPAAVKAAGRNDPCPCGSGKRYKACHGALA